MTDPNIHGLKYTWTVTYIIHIHKLEILNLNQSHQINFQRLILFQHLVSRYYRQTSKTIKGIDGFRNRSN